MRGFTSIHKIAALVTLATNLAWVSAQTDIPQKNLPRMPGATLVTGWPPNNLIVIAGKTTSTLQTANMDWYVSASMSRDGRLIGSAHPAEEFPSGNRTRPRLWPSVYSTADQKWKFYKELSIFDGSVPISPDGSKLACITRQKSGAPSQISILDLGTGKVTQGPNDSRNASHTLSWSPDNKRIAFEREIARFAEGERIPPLPGIFVLDVQSGKVTKIADGRSPSWSPSGEWIAFYDYPAGWDRPKRGWYARNSNRLSLIRPNGTGLKVLRTFGRNDSLVVTPVWSPNSRALLFSEFQGDNNDWVNISYLDLETNKVTKKFKKVLPVYAWIAGE